MITSDVKELANYVSKLLQTEGADETVITASNFSGDEIKFVDNEIIKTTRSTGNNIGIFANFGKKIVFTSLKNLTEDAAKAQVAKAVKFSKVLAPKDDWFGIANGTFKYKKIPDTFDKKIINLDSKSQIDLVESGVNASLAEGAKRSSGIMDVTSAEYYKLTSGGAEAEGEQTSAYFSLRTFKDKDASGHSTSTSAMLKGFDTEGAGKFAGQIAKQAAKPETGKGGKYTVILAPMAAAAILESAGGSLSMFDVESGTSFFVNQLGKHVANPIVSLIDDGTIPNGVGSSSFDAEGVPTQRNVAIDKGILKTYLYNTSMAKKYKTKTTANAGMISPQPHNILLEGNKISKENLFSQVENGLYVTNIWYTRFQNYTTGDFSTIPRDGMFLIKNGQIVKPVKQLRISENMLNMLKNISGIANDVQQITSWEVHTPTFTPHILIKNVNVTQPTG